MIHYAMGMQKQAYPWHFFVLRKIEKSGGLDFLQKKQVSSKKHAPLYKYRKQDN